MFTVSNSDELLAERTVRSMIGYWHESVVCPSVCLSVCDDDVAKRYIVEQNCPNK